MIRDDGFLAFFLFLFLIGLSAVPFGAVWFLNDTDSKSEVRTAIYDYYDDKNEIVTKIKNRENGTFLVEFVDGKHAVVAVEKDKETDEKVVNELSQVHNFD